VKQRLQLLPLAVFLFILPFPGTVTLRLLALGLALIACAWRWRQDGFPHVPARNALLFWGACALVSLAGAIDPAYSLSEIKNELGYPMAALIAFLTLTRSRDDAIFFLAALILGNLALSAFALRDNLFSGLPQWNEGGVAGGSGTYATYQLAILPVLMWAACVLPQRGRLALISALGLLQLLLALLVGQRAFWLAAALQGVFGLYLLRARGFVAISAQRMRALGAAAVILSLVAMVGATVTRDAVSVSRDPRITSLPAVTGRILEHPLIGKGFGRQAMSKAYPDLVSKEFPQFTHPHNLFLNYGLAMGIPGMLAIVLVFFALLRKFSQMSRAEDRIIAMAGICGILLVLGVIARNLTNDFFQRDLALLFWSIAGMLLGYAQHVRDAPGAASGGARA